MDAIRKLGGGGRGGRSNFRRRRHPGAALKGTSPHALAEGVLRERTGPGAGSIRGFYKKENLGRDILNVHEQRPRPLVDSLLRFLVLC
jgi:hypothetical protein